MTGNAPYKRVVIKISGESFCADEGCIGVSSITRIVEELLPLVQMKVQVAMVVGGGNIVRGRDMTDTPVGRTTADYMGMLATVINGVALRDVLESRGVASRVMSAIPMTAVCEPFIREVAIRHLELGRVVIFVAGTGNPFFTTDTCAALRACEMQADLLIKATKVDGVFDSDPVQNPAAKKYDRLTYEKVLADRLEVMDLTAISLCREAAMPILVLQLLKEGSLAGAIRGEKIGTLVGK